MQEDMFRKSEEAAGDVQSLYTGLVDLYVLAINPSLSELHDRGIMLKNEPIYVGKDQDGNVQTRVDIWLSREEPKIQTKVSFFVGSKPVVSSNDNPRWIDKFGASTYAATKEEAKYVDNASLRQAYPSEAELTEFLRYWGGLKTKTEFRLEDPLAIAKGNIEELEKFHGMVVEHTATENEKLGNPICVMLTVTENDGNRYQNVLNDKFGFAKADNQKKFNRHLENKESYMSDLNRSLNFDYQNSLELQKYRFGQAPEQSTSSEAATFDDDELAF